MAASLLARPLLDLHPIDASGELTLGNGYVAIDNLAVTSGKADIEARLRFAGGHSDGILSAAYGPLSTGVELRAGHRHPPPPLVRQLPRPRPLKSGHANGHRHPLVSGNIVAQNASLR